MKLRYKIAIGIFLVTVALAVHWSNKALDVAARSISTSPNAGRAINPGSDPSDDQLRRQGVHRQLRVDVQPAASLSIWIVDPPNRPPRHTILVLHGIRSNKTDMLTVGKKLAAADHRVVLVDSRGHGLSTGDWLGYGSLEARDLQQVLDELDRQRLLVGSIGVYGASYGGATAIILAGRDPRVKAVVVVTTFSSLEDQVGYYARNHGSADWLRRASPWVIRLAVQRAGKRGQFDPDEASPVTAITKTDANVLLFHGKADNVIPTVHSERVHAAAPVHSELVLLDDEDHDTIFHDRHGIIMTKTLAWYARHLIRP
jgi:dipeptidyl aminopeptidase/acylaminoacyl peptidase